MKKLAIIFVMAVDPAVRDAKIESLRSCLTRHQQVCYVSIYDGPVDQRHMSDFFANAEDQNADVLIISIPNTHTKVLWNRFFSKWSGLMPSRCINWFLSSCVAPCGRLPTQEYFRLCGLHDANARFIGDRELLIADLAGYTLHMLTWKTS